MEQPYIINVGNAWTPKEWWTNGFSICALPPHIGVVRSTTLWRYGFVQKCTCPFHHISSTGLPLVNPLPYCLMAVLRYFVQCILRHPRDSNLMAESCSASEDSSPICRHGNHKGKQGLAYLHGANECMFVFPKMEINMSWRVPDLPL